MFVLFVFVYIHHGQGWSVFFFSNILSLVREMLHGFGSDVARQLHRMVVHEAKCKGITK
jgi:hypothetical protein